MEGDNVPRTTAGGSTEMAAVSLGTRIPEFWTDQPKLWFVQLEAVLAPQKLGDEQNFNIVVTKLSKITIQAVSDILLKPPSTGKYAALKQRLIATFEESTDQQLKRLLTEMELGEQKPTQLMRRMLDLSGGAFPDSTIPLMSPPNSREQRSIFTRRGNKELDTG
ncbi:uncharacterized protein [Choristoneura fumiferana]|uniref:uncharacterized protein n=1 Tax=Choristoneura fumiferana TaxID=7141 RepID=UPI003D15B912